MGLDYTNECVNFRDVGDFINTIRGNSRFKQNQLLRGGSIDYVKNQEEIGIPHSIINLRNSADSELFESDYFHFPMANNIEKYDTSQKEVRIWLNQILKTFENPDFRFPVLVHCLSGKDRTGIVIAAILHLIGIEREVIVEEYLLSDGEVNEEWINLALDGMKDIESYFNRINLDAVTENLKAQLLRTF